MPNDTDDDFITQTRCYFLDPKHTNWRFAAFAKYCYNLPHFPSTTQNVRRQTAWGHWERHLRDFALGSDKTKKAKANELLQRIQETQQSQVKVQNFTINAIGWANTINATATGTAITTTTNLNPTNIVNNVGIGVDIKRESPVAVKQESPATTTKRKPEPEAEPEAEYAHWPPTPPLFSKRRRTTTGNTPYTDAQLAQLRSALPVTNTPPTALSIDQRLTLLQDQLTQFEKDRGYMLAELKAHWARFQEADRRSGAVVRKLCRELRRLVEEREAKEENGTLTSRDESEVSE